MTLRVSTSLWILLSASFLLEVSGHAYLFEPPSRNILKHQENKEFCPHCLQAGGPSRVIARGQGIWPTMSDPSSHGLCGDPVQSRAEPRSIADMMYMTASEPQRTYTAGSIVEFRVGLSTHHWGHFEFRICDHALDTSLSSAEAGQQCLNAHTLQRAPRSEACGDRFTSDCQPINPNHPERWYLPPPRTGMQVAGANWSDSEAKPIDPNNEVYVMRYVVPDDLSCDHCTLQWYYATGNTCAYDQDYMNFDPGFKFWQHYGASWATCANSCCGVGGLWGEEFWNCADIRISRSSSSSSTTSAMATSSTSTSTTTTKPAATTTSSETSTATTSTESSETTSTTSATPILTTAAPETSTTTTSSDSTETAIQSGDAVFLRSRSGWGALLDAEGSFLPVRARYNDKGTWQTFTVEKADSASAALRNGDVVFLTTHLGTQVDVEGESVSARWSDKGFWQSLIVEKAGGSGGRELIFPGDVLCFRAHTGKHIDIETDTARARWTDCGFWQGMQVEKQNSDNIVSSGDGVYLLAHTGHHLEVEGGSVQARFTDQGNWQRLTVINERGDAIQSGDAVFLIAHTSKMVDVEGELLQARFVDQGNWQRFIITKAQGGTIHEDDQIFLQAHTGKYVDVEGVSARARWNDQGSWQTFTIQKHHARLLQEAFQQRESSSFVLV